MPRRNKGPHLHWREERQVWEIRWFERGRKRSQSTRAEDRREAEKALAEFLIGTEPAGPRDPSGRVIADVLHAYGEERGPHVVDPARIAAALKVLIPFWGNKKVSDIREGACRAYCKHRRVSDGTTRRELTVLRAAVNRDYKQGRLTAPVAVWLPAQPESKDRWLTRTEAGRILRAARNTARGRLHLPLFILLGLYTGARKEAILSLRWPQVDFQRGLIDFNPPGRKRTGKGRPIIPIPRRLMTFLRLARKRGTETGHVIAVPRTVVDGNGDKRIIRQAVKDVKKGFHAAACRAGFATRWVPSRKTGPTRDGLPVCWVHPVTDVTPHVLRHTAASWMVQRGVSFAKVARYLGHADSRTTERIYAHHAPDYLEDASAAFDRRPTPGQLWVSNPSAKT